MNFLIIQENGRHEKNRRFRECFCIQRALLKLNHGAIVWGEGHSNFKEIPNFDSFDVIIDLENYNRGWIPDLSNIKAFKILWAIDYHCRGGEYYKNIYRQGNYNLELQATLDYVTKDNLWFPNCYDDALIYPKVVTTRADVGFCGNVQNRGPDLDFLKRKFNFISDIFVIGHDMVNAINSYKIHFNKNIANDINYRSFETIGCKIPLITNYNYQYKILGFNDMENCCMYNNRDELEAKIITLLTNPRLCESIAERGYTLSQNHTFNKRAIQLINYLEDVL